MPYTLSKYTKTQLPTIPTGTQNLNLVKAQYFPHNKSIRVYFGSPEYDGLATDSFTDLPQTEWVLGQWIKRLDLSLEPNKSFGTQDKALQYVTDLINAKIGESVTVKVEPSSIDGLLNASIIRLA